MTQLTEPVDRNPLIFATIFVTVQFPASGGSLFTRKFRSRFVKINLLPKTRASALSWSWFAGFLSSKFCSRNILLETISRYLSGRGQHRRSSSANLRAQKGYPAHTPRALRLVYRSCKSGDHSRLARQECLRAGSHVKHQTVTSN